MMTDPIADMLTRIRNASRSSKKEVEVPFSNLKKSLAEIFARAGYLEKVEEVKVGKSNLRLTLKYYGSVPAITHIKRVSTPGHRRYIKAKDVETVLNGYGLSVISTPSGLLTNKEARAKKMGGELICEIY